MPGEDRSHAGEGTCCPPPTVASATVGGMTRDRTGGRGELRVCWELCRNGTMTCRELLHPRPAVRGQVRAVWPCDPLSGRKLRSVSEGSWDSVSSRHGDLFAVCGPPSSAKESRPVGHASHGSYDRVGTGGSSLHVFVSVEPRY
jgi:hypothetical protein